MADKKRNQRLPKKKFLLKNLGMLGTNNKYKGNLLILKIKFKKDYFR